MKTAVYNHWLFFDNLISFKFKKSMKVLARQSQKTFLLFIFITACIIHEVVGLVFL